MKWSNYYRYVNRAGNLNRLERGTYGRVINTYLDRNAGDEVVGLYYFFRQRVVTSVVDVTPTANRAAGVSKDEDYVTGFQGGNGIIPRCVPIAMGQAKCSFYVDSTNEYRRRRERLVPNNGIGMLFVGAYRYFAVEVVVSWDDVSGVFVREGVGLAARALCGNSFNGGAEEDPMDAGGEWLVRTEWIFEFLFHVHQRV